MSPQSDRHDREVSSQSILRKLLQEELLPALVERGFQQLGASRGRANRSSGKGRRLGLLYRTEGDVLHVMRVQIRPHGRAALIIRFVAVPPSGILGTDGNVLLQDAAINPDLVNGAYELMRNPRRVIFFSADRWWRRTNEPHITKMIEEVILCLDEVDLALRYGVVSKHI